jgi:hypothetical protein
VYNERGKPIGKEVIWKKEKKKGKRLAQLTHTGGASQKRDESGAEWIKKSRVRIYAHGVRRVVHRGAPQVPPHCAVWVCQSPRNHLKALTLHHHSLVLLERYTHLWMRWIWSTKLGSLFTIHWPTVIVPASWDLIRPSCFRFLSFNNLDNLHWSQ